MIGDGKRQPTTVLRITGKIAEGKEHTIMTYHKWPPNQLSIGPRQTALPFAAAPETNLNSLNLKESTEVKLIITHKLQILQVELRMR